MDRREIGSWLSGPRAALPDDQQPPRQDHPGQRLGLPSDGPGSIAPFLSRLVALFIDWFACLAITAATWGDLQAGGTGQLVTLGIFLLENVLLVATLGSTLGHKILGLQVIRLDDRPVTLVDALVRGVLLCLVVPAIIWDQDHRSAHDWVRRTAIVRGR
ncbi:RDD family protein [Kytococcus sp. Marseille-QA3725]